MLYFCGDIHGYLDELLKALDEAGFDKENDTLIACGDLVDRGPDSYKVVKLLDEKWFKSVRGNHDQWCIDSYNDPMFDSYNHRYYGGDWFYELTDEEKLEVVNRLVNLPYAMEVEYKDTLFGVVHAEVPFFITSWQNFIWNIEQENMTAINVALWGRSVFAFPYEENDVTGIDITIHGHNTIEKATRINDRVWLDTGRYSGITVISAEDILNMEDLGAST